MPILIPAEFSKIQPNMRGLVRSNSTKKDILPGQLANDAGNSPFPQGGRGKGANGQAGNPTVFNGFAGDSLGSRAQYLPGTSMFNPLNQFHNTATVDPLPHMSTATGQPTNPVPVKKDNLSIQPHERGKFFQPRKRPIIHTAGGGRVTGGGPKADNAFHKTRDEGRMPQQKAQTAHFLKLGRVASFMGVPVKDVSAVRQGTLNMQSGRWSTTKKGAAG